MNSFEEKLSILSEMIAFAKVDEAFKEEEYQFLIGVAKLLGVDKKTFDRLLGQKHPPVKFKSETERIVQFHRLLMLMNIDDTQSSSEIEHLYNVGLRMGLPPNAITLVLEVMHQYPNKIIPPKVLLHIFRSHYN